MIDITRETIVSLDDVARRLRVTVRTVRNWILRESNPLDATKYGGKVVTSLEALQRFGRPNTTKAGKPAKPIADSRQHQAATKRLKDVHGI